MLSFPWLTFIQKFDCSLILLMEMTAAHLITPLSALPGKNFLFSFTHPIVLFILSLNFSPLFSVLIIPPQIKFEGFILESSYGWSVCWLVGRSWNLTWMFVSMWLSQNWHFLTCMQRSSKSIWPRAMKLYKNVCQHV